MPLNTATFSQPPSVSSDASDGVVSRRARAIAVLTPAGAVLEMDATAERALSVDDPTGRLFWDQTRIRLPIFGSIAHKICLSRFARTLSSLIRSGVPILEVLQIVSNTVGNVVMEKAIRVTASDIERGESMSMALSKHNIFPSMIIRMITAGEQTGKLETMLERISNFLDDEIETTLSGLTSLIEPLLIVFLGVTVGGIAICMFLPIFKMSELINPPR